MGYKDPESKREYNRRYNQENRERIAAQRQRRLQENSAKINEGRRARRARDRERINEQSRARYASDPVVRARDRESSAKYRAAKNKDELRDYHRAYYAENRESFLAYRLLKAHGMRPTDWAAMWEAQDGKCYLCGRAMAIDKKIAVEHDHDHCPTNTSCSICRRGLAHIDCNTAIGMAGDDPDRLRRMADALEAAKLGVAKRMATADKQLTFDTDMLA